MVVDGGREEVRPWNKLSRRGKRRRIWHRIADFVMRCIVGDYMRGGVRGAYHWIRCHVWNRYHIIDLAKHSDGYRWGWIDRDWAMYLACFNLLCDFVEQEDPKIGTRSLEDYRPSGVTSDEEWIDRHLIQAQIDDDSEIRSLYEWWKSGRAEEQKRYEASDYSHKVREELDARDEEMLGRLMKIRTRLWT